MPVSPKCNKKPISRKLFSYINNLDQTHIKILDLGIGNGDFAEIIRKMKFDNKIINITGIEIWKKYKNPKWELYDEIVIGDILKYVKDQSKPFDVILLLDVLEHFNYEEGLTIIENIKRINNGLIIISTPVTKCPQGAYKGNSWETHRHIWKIKELNHFGFKVLQSKWVLLIGAIKERQFWPLFTKFSVLCHEHKN